ncbi:hypothetical protein ELY33_05050 [Vreelandella andesensis]|uniref:Uncharacterized protein n=1 Tax=Vreelandella andesensis TaxID=447567 RepID=A0A433KT36_9GAMM|nr:hypothetical protein [Halomonas andesensis]RUR32749.1 hypothetical protein ELY33_05050 [Halomonas andesensis]
MLITHSHKTQDKTENMKSFTLSLCLLLAVISSPAEAMTKMIGKGYCSIRHPVESLTTTRTVSCESQHVIQRQSGGSDIKNTIWISATEHHYLDRSIDKPWDKERPWFNIGNSSLERAYMQGVYARGFHFITYDHHANGVPTLWAWDGASHLTYAVGATFNVITKELSYLGYQIERMKKGQETQFADALIGIIFNLMELGIGIAYSILGIIVGTIFNPIDTVLNIPGAVLLSAEAMVEGVANTISDLIAIVTLGFVVL